MVRWRTPDDWQRNCPKNVEFLDKNKFGKIRASVGFIIKKVVLSMLHVPSVLLQVTYLCC